MHRQSVIRSNVIADVSQSSLLVTSL